VSRGTAPTDSVIVRSGDTLWSIAARHLGPDAPVAEIAAQWPRWFDANREVIGNDPDLILPGQQLRPPAHQDSALESGVRP
jgi:nucleoid-associated protein YgaU